MAGAIAPIDPPAARPTVLIVDDNTDHRAFLRAAAAPRYRVVTASNGLDPCTIARRHRPGIILLDLLIPIVDGSGVVRQFRALILRGDSGGARQPLADTSQMWSPSCSHREEEIACVTWWRGYSACPSV
jgi:hypothetical protein